MARLGDDRVIAEMLHAAERIADALVDRTAPQFSRKHHEFPDHIRNHLERVQHQDERLAPEVYKIGPAAHTDRNTATEESAYGSSTRGPFHDPDAKRVEISLEEAQELCDQVRDRKPDFAGTGNRVHLIDTSSGPAVMRSNKDEPTVTFMKKWMPENTAIAYGRDHGMRTPRVLHAGVDSVTGRAFTIMQPIPGRTLKVDDPELMSCLPEILDQVHPMSPRPVPKGMEMDIPEWQRQMIQHADDEYHRLPPDRRAKLDELGLGPLSEYVRPDRSRFGEPVVFGHNDMYPGNVNLDARNGKMEVWLFDLENAGPSDSIYDGAFFLDRSLNDETVRAQATAMWAERISSVNPAVDAEAALRMYRDIQDWRVMAMSPDVMPGVTDPGQYEKFVDLYHKRLSRHSEPWPNFSREELSAVFRGWGQ
ncbi:phosphotransferase [Nocardia sp. NPDC050799]|uniref:phosphotransferase family protein n=1 Tax=Nocardia sp. NPDC050799 TaxID=3154842 RepID=UPI0033FA272D